MSDRMTTAVIIGGTGTLGQETTRQCLDGGLFDQIIIASRDELKQREMRARLPDRRLVFKLVDVRDPSSIGHFLIPADSVVFHFAALKHVDAMEGEVSECVRTNTIGVMNAARLAYLSRAKHFVFTSTDKAVLPINAYGCAKALSEKFLFSLNRAGLPTRFSVFRWGNVIGSRGSVIPDLVRWLYRFREVPLTHSDMTRYWISVEKAVSFMLAHYTTAPLTEAMIPPGMKSCGMARVIDLVAKIMEIESYSVNYVGVRPGEKIHETLVSTHYKCERSDTSDQYTDEEMTAMLKPVVDRALRLIR